MILWAGLLLTPLLGQSRWMWNGRTHPELRWSVIATENFRVHFHQGLESDAVEAAAIAEAAFPRLLEQLDVPSFGPVDIVLTNEDEIMNGFARPDRRVVIWVNQNSAAGWFLGSRHWLEQVITHELQHVVLLEAVSTWLGVINLLVVPSWFIEGMAEYYSEQWRVGRSDVDLKRQVYRNKLSRLDAHDSGYAKVLYMADRFGDSTLVKIVHYRQRVGLGRVKLTLPYRFKKAVKEVTGVTVKQLNDAWRRTMQTYYFSVLGQLEGVAEVGRAFPLPEMSSVSGLAVSPDSSQVAIIGRRSGAMRDDGLYIMSLDSNRTIKEINWGRLSSGGTVSNHPSWSPDGSRIAVSQYRRGQHGSLLWDIRIIDLESGRRSWLTSSAKAHDPVWSPDGESILYVGQQQRASNLFIHDLATAATRQLTHFSRDTVIQDPRWSPDGSKIAFSFQRADGQLEIGVINDHGGKVTQITAGNGPNLLPLWSGSGAWVAFTSFGSGIPNLFRVPAEGGEPVQITHVAEGFYGVQILGPGDEILAMTLPDVDSVRVRMVPLMSTAEPAQVTIRDPYSSWRSANVDVTLPAVRTPDHPAAAKPERYRWWKHWGRVYGFVLPLGAQLSGFGYWADALDRQQLIVGADYLISTGGYSVLAQWINTSHRAILTTTLYKDATSRFRGLGDEFIVESPTGVDVEVMLPFNFGNNLASNHRLSARLLARRRAPVYYSTKTFSVDTVTEGGWALAYRWKRQRADARLKGLPQSGAGIKAVWEQLTPAVYGDRTYATAWLEGFHHLRVPVTPLVLYSQLGATLTLGNAPRQNLSGLYASAPFELHPMLSPLEESRYLESIRILSPRGLEQDIPGDWAALASHELRLPVMGALPVNLLGFGLADVTAALFLDYGVAAAGGKTQTVTTSGMELKLNLTLGDVRLLTIALGNAAGLFSDKELFYLRLGTIQPF
ncbi:MAG: PD40 domain-containing protein [Candidatus Marinimicrobia bacterium]|nr:PD40 domain-containing protein [Candidatus Neomarinimicrobiota bacterium]